MIHPRKRHAIIPVIYPCLWKCYKLKSLHDELRTKVRIRVRQVRHPLLAAKFTGVLKNLLIK